MTGYLLDTNAVSEARKVRPNAGFARWICGVDPASVYVSVLTCGELRRGVEAAPQAKRADLEFWLTSQLSSYFEGRILAFGLDEANRWGILEVATRSKGRTVPIVDCMLAASALVHDLTIVTRNDRDFVGLCETFNPWS